VPLEWDAMPILFMANEGNPNCVIVELVDPDGQEATAYGLRSITDIKENKEVQTASNCQLLPVTASNCQLLVLPVTASNWQLLPVTGSYCLSLTLHDMCYADKGVLWQGPLPSQPGGTTLPSYH
jgi:hypothetical protein